MTKKKLHLIMKKKKLPYIIRYIRYCLNSFFMLLFPAGIEQDEFSKRYKNKQ
jgi:hypothetical protein